jgi:histidinol-phosphatase (PHP family)
MMDYHIHSNYSADSQQSIQAIVDAARKQGLSEIALTDHLDIDYPYDNITFVFDEIKRRDEIKQLQAKYSDINIVDGIEVGVTQRSIQDNIDYLMQREFDFVIASVHIVSGIDPYYDAFFEGRTTKQAYIEYLSEISMCLDGFDDYNVIGHIGYASRFCKNEQSKIITYSDYSDIIDEILKKIIAKGKGIEVNTYGIRTTGDTLPSQTIVKRYKQLGGDIITIGSDAHTTDRVGEHVEQTYAFLKSIGFKYMTRFCKRKPYFVKI